MRRITLEKVMDSRGVHLIAVKKCPLFDQGDIIELRTPDDTYHVIFDAAKKAEPVQDVYLKISRSGGYGHALHSRMVH